METSSLENYKNVTTTVMLRGKPVKVHALCTGTVAVKQAFRTLRGSELMAKPNILLDGHYTEYMPIWAWVIEHPEGNILIDTGEIEAIKNLDVYLKRESSINRYLFKHTAKFKIRQEDELNRQFDTIGLKPDDIKLVLLTHLHLDHTDGIKFFPKQEIRVSALEYQKPNSNMPSTYPSWFNPNTIQYKESAIPFFKGATPLTAAEDLLYIHTPGHTLGHGSVLFKTDDFDILFAGDVSYNQEQVINNELAGVNHSFQKSRETYAMIKAYAAARKLIYLPSHDGNAGTRLANAKFL